MACKLNPKKRKISHSILDSINFTLKNTEKQWKHALQKTIKFAQ